MNPEQLLMPLIGKPISLFDNTGGVLDIDGNYVTNWWEVGEFVLTQASRKYFFLRDPNTNEKGRVKMNRIAEVDGNNITLNG